MPVQRVLDVLLGDTVIGLLRGTHEGPREHASFQYADAWFADPQCFPIDPALPLVAGAQFAPASRAPDASCFHGVIADTEPDGWARRVILRDHAKRRQAARDGGRDLPPVVSAVDFLLAVDDETRVGALRFRDEDGHCQRAAEPGRRTVPPLFDLPDLVRASAAVERRTETDVDLAFLRGRGTSLGGMRPKCSVRDTDGALCIGKFPSIEDDRAVTKGEVLAMVLARRAGIDVADARLVDSDGVPVALVRRFDRMRDVATGRERRLLYASAATMLGVARGDPTEHSYTELADVIRQLSADAMRDLAELWRRVAFSILITNVDDHLRNHGFLHVQGALWRLSPAFDVNPFPGRVRELKTWISDAAGPSASIDALVGAASYFGLTAARAADILREVEAAVSTWRAQARTLGCTPAETDALAEAFEHEERERARRHARAS